MGGTFIICNLTFLSFWIDGCKDDILKYFAIDFFSVEKITAKLGY